MKETLENRPKAISYLLGELSGAERDDFEERLFLDEDFSLFINDVENDLIDEYVRGELRSGEKMKFENAYLTNETRREKIKTAQILQAELFSETTVATAPKVSFWQSLKGFFRLPNFSLASGLAVVLLFFLGTIWFITGDDVDKNRAKIIENTNQPDFLPPTDTPENLPVNNQLNTNKILENNKIPVNSNTTNGNTKKDVIKPKEPETEKTPSKQVPRFFAFTLLPPTRSSSRPILNIPPDAKQVRLQIVNSIEEKYVKYTVEITDENGEIIWKQNIPSTGEKAKKSIVLNLSPEVLKSGAYEITLLGTSAEGDVEEINFYNFIVNKK